MLMSGRRLKSHVAALGHSTDPTARFPQNVDVRAAGRADHALLEQGTSNEAVAHPRCPCSGGQPSMEPCPGGGGG